MGERTSIFEIGEQRFPLRVHWVLAVLLQQERARGGSICNHVMFEVSIAVR